MAKKYIKDSVGVAVHAGFPNPAAELPFGNPDFNKLLIKHPASTFCMRLEGSEWENDGIFAGDLVVIDRALDPTKKDKIIWWNKDTFMISSLTELPPDTEVWGTVTAIIHQLRP